MLLLIQLRLSVEFWAQSGGYGSLITVGWGENERGGNETAHWLIESENEEVIGGLKEKRSKEVFHIKTWKHDPLRRKWQLMSDIEGKFEILDDRAEIFL